MKHERFIWRILAIEIYIPSVLLAVSRGIIITALPIYLLIHGYPYTMVSMVISSVNIGALAIDFLAGFLLYILGFRRLNTLAITLILLSIFGILILNENYHLLLVLLAFFGVGRSLWSMSRKYFISAHIPYEFRGRASSFIGASERIGLFVGPLIVSIVLALADVFHALIISTIIALLVLLLDLLPRKELENSRSSTNHIEKYDPIDPQYRSIIEEISSLLGFRFIMLYTALFMIQGIRSVRQLMLPSIGLDLVGLESSLVSLVIGVAGAFDVLMAYPAGYIMDRKGRIYAVSTSFTIISLSYIILSLSRSPAEFIFGALILGVGNGLGAGSMITMGTDIYNIIRREKQAVIFLTLWQLIGDLGTVIMPILIGFIASSQGLVIACLISSILSIVSVVLMNLFGRDISSLPN
ncbi:MAG: MFS transporter [Sulfolobales archaeon]